MGKPRLFPSPNRLPRGRLRLFVFPLLAAFLSAFPLAPAGAETPEEKGLAIAIEADRRDTGFGNFYADQTMVLHDRHDQKSVRELHMKALEQADDGDRTIIVFDRPRDIDGTALLTYTHKVGDDDQWLYLPALKRVKRISSSNRSGSFVGSEFSYEDLASQEVERYTYRYLRDEVLNGIECFVIERYPLYENSGYTREVVWIDKAEYRVQKDDYYDRKKTLLKTLVMKGYQQYLDRYWRADEMRMVNHQTGKSTVLLWKNYKFHAGLTKKDFTKNALRRAR